jgi:hypothetical protein
MEWHTVYHIHMTHIHLANMMIIQPIHEKVDMLSPHHTIPSQPIVIMYGRQLWITLIP